MPAAAVASFTPAITGMSGTSVGARGETAVDMRAPCINGEVIMAGLVPAIHVFLPLMGPQDVDGRDKPGHDDRKYYWLRGSDSEFYFFAGAILESLAASGLAASGLASDFATASSGLSMRSTLAASRSLAT